MGCCNVKYVLIVSERNTGVHLHPEAVVRSAGGRYTLSKEITKPAAPEGSSPKNFTLASKLY